MLFFRVLVFLWFSCSTYIQSARSPCCPRRQTLRREGKDEKELFCLSYIRSFQVISVHLPWFSCATAGRLDGCIISHRKKTGSFSLSLSPSNMGRLQMELSAPNTIPSQSQLGNVRQFAAKHCTLSKHCTSNKTSLADFSYTQHVMWMQHHPNLLLAWLHFIFHSFQ